MDPVTGAALIGGGASLLGGIMGNSSAKKEAKKQREWQERMSNTAHQREVVDLRAAGLNPMLSVMGGNGASTPSGAVADVKDALTPATNSALAARQNLADLELKKASTGAANEQAMLNRENSAKAVSDSKLSQELAKKAQAETKVIEANAPERETKGMLWDSLRKKLEPAKQIFDGDWSAKGMLSPPRYAH